jgi:hypothetical protein
MKTAVFILLFSLWALVLWLALAWQAVKERKEKKK